ncbi:hypothetical protein SETIT_2G276200v2 [Setaria italica]|uniref:AP2/ERF domain-containing protein n=1 Tax=Setaria italica TaxID=4555 RepID=K4A0T0_SETIT|nr:hypothetical protein SETIT_2G276200v2 [Setaria italica]
MIAESGFPCRSASASTSSEHQTVWTSPPKQPAGRTKFRETRHPVRMPGRRGCRLWLGTFDTAEGAAHARTTPPCSPSPALAPASTSRTRRGCSRCRPPNANLAEVRHAVAETVENFLRREAAPEDNALSASSSTATPSSLPATMAAPPMARTFELDVFNNMSWDLYSASLAQGMLMEPPSAVMEFGDANIVDVPLWSY